MGRRVLKFDGLSGRGLWWRLRRRLKKGGAADAAGCVEGLHPTGETTHYDLCVAGAPSNHVRCASLRSGSDSACGAEGGGLP